MTYKKKLWKRMRYKLLLNHNFMLLKTVLEIFVKNYNKYYLKLCMSTTMKNKGDSELGMIFLVW